jgi:hypothetical protein
MSSENPAASRPHGMPSQAERVPLSNRPFVISCPAVGVELHCDLNEARDRIIGTWIIGNDSPETRRIADLMVAAGNAGEAATANASSL